MDSEAQALRYNERKLDWSLIHYKALTPMIQVLEFGAKKYSPDNWKKGMPREQILNSAMRHLVALMDGEEIDPESGLPHIGHLMCNGLFYSFFQQELGSEQAMEFFRPKQITPERLKELLYKDNILNYTPEHEETQRPYTNPERVATMSSDEITMRNISKDQFNKLSRNATT